MNDHDAKNAVPAFDQPAASQPANELDLHEKHAPVRRTRPGCVVVVAVLPVALLVFYCFAWYAFNIADDLDFVMAVLLALLVWSIWIAVELWLLHAWARIAAIVL